MSSSRKCYDALMKSSLIKKNYTSWKEKTKGASAGVILEGTTKTGIPKKVFVKNYLEDRNGASLHNGANALGDFAAFTILKKCGLHAPKVKLAAADDGLYIFSTDVAQRKKPNKECWYFDLDELPYEIKNKNLHPTQTSNNRPIENKIPIDKKSYLKAIIIARLLNLEDLHGGNIGYYISKKGNLAKAKLACIDFLFDPHKPVSKHLSLKELIDDAVENFFRHLDNSSAHKKLVSQCSEADYIKAFEEISKQFLQTCAEIKRIIQTMSVELEDEKKGIYGMLERWQENFIATKSLIEKYQNKVEREDTPSPASDTRLKLSP